MTDPGRIARLIAENLAMRDDIKALVDHLPRPIHDSPGRGPTRPKND